MLLLLLLLLLAIAAAPMMTDPAIATAKVVVLQVKTRGQASQVAKLSGDGTGEAVVTQIETVDEFYQTTQL